MELSNYTRGLDGPFIEHASRGNDWFGPLFGLIFLVVIVLLTVYVVKAFTGNRTTPTDLREPLDIAKERYAKGEITKDELAEIKKELK